MPFLCHNLCIRNDDHCPNCRKYFVSIHKTKEEALTKTKKNLMVNSNYHDSKFDELCLNSSCWIDEWKRRRNGDLYNVVNIDPEKQIDLPGYFDNVDEIEDDYDDADIKYMLLSVQIRNLKICPSNIKFAITFYEKKHQIFNINLWKITTETQRNLLSNYERIWIPTNENTENEMNDEDDSDDISELDEIDKIVDGTFYQIIKLEFNKTICLHDYVF
jgi:hypothetical protein